MNADGLGLLKNGGHDGVQFKRWITGTLSGEDLGTFSSAAICILMKDVRNGMVLYHAPGSRVCNDVLCNFDDVETMRVHELEPEMKQITAQAPVSKQESSFKPTASQQKALEFLAEQKHGVSLLASPCGSGKTLILGWHAAALGFSTVVIAAPLIASAEQGLRRLAAFLPGHQPVAFWSGSCSIDGVTAVLDEDRLQQSLKAKSKVLIGTTYDSAGKVLAALKAKRRNGAGTLVLIDEAHNIGAAEDNPARLLTLGGGKLRKTILATATPPKSMMKELFDGQDIPTFSYSMREAIANGEIADYTITMPLVQDQNFRPVELADLEQGEDEWDAMGRAIFHAGAMHHDGARRSIVYCYSIAQCQAYEDAFRQVCEKYLGVEFWIGRITCEQSSGQRAGLLKTFQKPVKQVRLHILTSIRVLDEALDAPSCDSVFFTDVSSRITEKSWLRAVQRLSRATRLDRNNLHKVARGYIWADLEENENIASLLSTLQHNDPEVANKVRVHSSQYDVAVGNKEVAQLCHLELEEWQERFLVSHIDPRELIELKVNWICANVQASRPNQSLKASLNLPTGKTVDFSPGHWLDAIKANWLVKTPLQTKLTNEQMSSLVNSCAWLAGVILNWQAAENEDMYTPSLEEKLSWLVQYCAKDKPAQKDSIKIVLPSGRHFQFKAGAFVDSLRGNWLGSRSHSCLTALQKACLEEECHWFTNTIKRWEILAAKSTYKATIQEQVDWILEFCTDARPDQAFTIKIPLANGDTFDFKAGSFAKSILNNWVEGRKANTRLTDQQKTALESCSWMPDLIRRYQANALHSPFRPTVAQRVLWMTEHCTENRPKQRATILTTDPDGHPYEFQAGSFLNHISANFVQTRGTPHIKLTAEQISCICTVCKWIPDAQLDWQAAAEKVFKPTVDQKVGWLIEHCADHKPKFASVVSIVVDDSVTYEFKPGSFLNDVRKNFVERAPQRTHLTEDQLSRLKQKCKWMPTYIESCQSSDES